MYIITNKSFNFKFYIYNDRHLKKYGSNKITVHKFSFIWSKIDKGNQKLKPTNLMDKTEISNMPYLYDEKIGLTQKRRYKRRLLSNYDFRKKCIQPSMSSQIKSSWHTWVYVFKESLQLIGVIIRGPEYIPRVASSQGLMVNSYCHLSLK